MNTTKNINTIYTEVSGTTVILDGNENTRGTVTSIHYGVGHVAVGAFVALDRGGMVYVTLGQLTGDRNERHEYTDWRVISRDEFDSLTQITLIRTELGWR